MILLMMVQKSQGQPPGIYPKPPGINNGISTTFPSLNCWVCRISGCHQQIVPMVPLPNNHQCLPAVTLINNSSGGPFSTTCPASKTKICLNLEGSPIIIRWSEKHKQPKMLSCKKNKTPPKKVQWLDNLQKCSERNGFCWWISLTCFVTLGLYLLSMIRPFFHDRNPSSHGWPKSGEHLPPIKPIAQNPRPSGSKSKSRS